MLHKLIEFGAPINDLLIIYILYIRSVCEQSCVVWHSSLTVENEDDLERIQKTALKIIYKQKYIDYENALNMSKLKKLSDRRKILCLKFAKKSVKNESAQDMFPIKDGLAKGPLTRHPEIYQVHKAKTSRMLKSPLIYMQHLLNDDVYNFK